MKSYDNDAYREDFVEGVYGILSDDPDWNRANAIIDLFDSAPAAENGRDVPLTLDELREMDGEPVFIVSSAPAYTEWGIVRVVYTNGHVFLGCAGAVNGFGNPDHYGETWRAYRCKQEM